MNIFKAIIDKEIKADIIYEDNRVIAFKDINPKTPGHFLVVPKVESTNLMDIDKDDLEYLIVVARDLAVKTIKELNVSGFNLVVNNGKDAGQEVFWTHIHIIPTIK